MKKRFEFYRDIDCIVTHRLNPLHLCSGITMMALKFPRNSVRRRVLMGIVKGYGGLYQKVLCPVLCPTTKMVERAYLLSLIVFVKMSLFSPIR